MSTLENIILAKSASLIELMKQYKVVYDVGSNKHIKCPFPAHHATGLTPSFKVYEESNSFFCWGCKKSGSTIDFVMGMEGISSIEAVNLILKKFKIKRVVSDLVKVALKSRKKEDLNIFKVSKELNELFEREWSANLVSDFIKRNLFCGRCSTST